MLLNAVGPHLLRMPRTRGGRARARYNNGRSSLRVAFVASDDLRRRARSLTLKFVNDGGINGDTSRARALFASGVTRRRIQSSIYSRDYIYVPATHRDSQVERSRAIDIRVNLGEEVRIYAVTKESSASTAVNRVRCDTRFFPSARFVLD